MTQPEPLQGRLALDIASAVRDSGGKMTAAGRWRWLITGPAGTVIIRSRSQWPHRKLRQKIRARTGISLPRERNAS